MTHSALLPTEYSPESVSDFIGPARIVAQRLVKSANMCVCRGSPAAHLFTGDSGSGKTELASFAIRQFECNPSNVTHECGVNITVDMVRSMFDSLRMTSLWGGYRAVWFDEIDLSSRDARAALLAFCGEKTQPRETLIVATTNLTLEQLDALEKADGAKGRISSRFQVHEVPCPSAEECVPLVKVWLAEPDAFKLCHHAGLGPNGKPGHPVNVRGLLKDTLSYMQL